MRQHRRPYRLTAALLPTAAMVGTLLVVAVPSAGAAAPDGYVASGPVTPVVQQVPVGGVDPAAARALADERGRNALHGVVALSAPVPATGYAAVGAVWDQAADTSGQRASVRTETDGDWSAWTALHTDPEHGPDPGTVEAAGSRPGTDPYVVGDVDAVQLRVSGRPGDRAPAGLTLVVIDPDAEQDQSAARLGRPHYRATDGNDVATPRPGIYSRAQWGADEGMRDGFAGYGEISGSFVHHTVNANDYSANQVPSILRSIYAYHVQGRGWSDIGYNFLVDRFGRVWEGRWGGIGRAVIGAHTLGYNEESFAMSAIGNFENVQPRKAMLRAYSRLYAWKLSLYGVAAQSTVRIDGDSFRAVNGHRDAASTACPGRHLYARLGRIRTTATNHQSGWAGRGLGRSVVGDPRPDLLVRDGAQLRVLAGDSSEQLLTESGTVRGSWESYSWLRIVGDWNGDGRRDLMGREDGELWLFPGLGNGRFGARVGGWDGWGSRTMLTPLGDWTGDGRPDLAARLPGGTLWLFPGRGGKGVRDGYALGGGFGDVGRVLGVGRWNADGAPDLMTRDRDGALWLWRGNGPGGLLQSRRVATDASRYDLMLGSGDLDRDGNPDLVARDRTSQQLYLLPGTSGGSLGRRVPIAGGPTAGDLLG